MAQVYDLNFNPSLDGNGDPYPGALLHVYIPGTTTNKATYTTSAMSVLNANPLVADSAGRFGQMFATEGTLFDLVLTDSAGGNSRTFTDVAAVGGTSNTFEKDFGANGRFQVYGAGGVVEIETGNPTGDDVGGTGRIGGWDLTKGDTLTIDYTDTALTGNQSIAGDQTVTGNVAITGSLTIGASSPYEIIYSVGTCTALGQYDITIPATFDTFRLLIRGLKSSAGGNIDARFSFDNGATYKAGATDYNTEQQAASFSAATMNLNTYTTTQMLRLSIRASGTGYVGASDMMLTTGSTGESALYGTWYTAPSAGLTDGYIYSLQAQTNNTSFGRVTNLRLIMSAGTMTFRYALIGVSGF